jgi:hypothetical protein
MTMRTLPPRVASSSVTVAFSVVRSVAVVSSIVPGISSSTRSIFASPAASFGNTSSTPMRVAVSCEPTARGTAPSANRLPMRSRTAPRGSRVSTTPRSASLARSVVGDAGSGAPSRPRTSMRPEGRDAAAPVAPITPGAASGSVNVDRQRRTLRSQARFSRAPAVVEHFFSSFVASASQLARRTRVSPAHNRGSRAATARHVGSRPADGLAEISKGHRSG